MSCLGLTLYFELCPPCIVCASLCFFFVGLYPRSYLSHLLEPKPEVVATASEVRDHRRHLSALSNFSIGDLFKDVRDGPKNVKFPEKLLKVLEQKLQNIAMGKDPACVSPVNFYTRY